MTWWRSRYAAFSWLCYTPVRVRRVLSVLMAMLFSFWLIQPVLSFAQETEIHECCRRAGKHHCMMGRGSAEGPTFSSAPCPMYQWHTSAMAAMVFDLAVSIETQTALAVSVLLLAVTLILLARISRTTESRGPPVLSFA